MLHAIKSDRDCILNHLNSKQWRIATPAPAEFIQELIQRDINPVLAQVLYQRGYTTPEHAGEFFAPYRADDNPFRMKGMDEAVYRLRMAIRDGDLIVVYGDFDADGVTSTVLLTEVLGRLGANVRPYIPDRVDEGYGLNSPALKHLAEQGVRVVVTVDCGIRSVREVEDGNEYGLDMIITDHHSVGPVVPPALAVINPKQPGCPYPEKMLAGVGIAYKIAQGLFMEAQRRGYRTDDDWRPDDWLDLVAIGTVADIAPLRGENRELVQGGLKILNQPRRAGLQALYSVAKLRPGTVNTVSIGFVIGPRLNAAGRLRSAMLSYRLLAAADAMAAGKLAHELNAINRERQEKTNQMQDWAEESMPEVDELPLLFAADRRFEQGVVGLIASRLTDRYYRPSVVLHVGEEESHGSCRSIPEFHITHALQDCDDLLEKYGGHAAAAGFTIANQNISRLRERLIDLAAQELAERELVPVLDIDSELPLNQVSVDLIDELSVLEPTGEANPAPLFVSHGVRIDQRQQVGIDGRHLKLMLSAEDSPSLEAIAFRRGEQYNFLPDMVDVVFHLEINEWKSQRRAQLNIQDIRPAEVS
jgi:single-stranded-DNA-specific exonuclease